MAQESYSVYEAIINSTSSELILFFVIVAVAVIPYTVVVNKNKKAQRQHELEQRELEKEERQQVITVIKEVSGVISKNTEVTSAFKVTLENSVGRIHMRIDEGVKTTEKISNDVAQVNVVQQTMLDNQRDMGNDIKQLLLTMKTERT